MPATKRGRRSPGGKKKKQSDGFIRRLLNWFRDVLGAQLGDVYGIGLTVLAVLCALGIWFNLAGPIGRFLELAFRGLLGVGGLFTPIVFGYLAYEMFVTRPGPDRPRITIGLAVLAEPGQRLVEGLAPQHGRLRLVELPEPRV